VRVDFYPQIAARSLTSVSRTADPALIEPGRIGIGQRPACMKQRRMTTTIGLATPAPLEGSAANCRNGILALLDPIYFGRLSITRRALPTTVRSIMSGSRR
jgi:hypothetical protein